MSKLLSLSASVVTLIALFAVGYWGFDVFSGGEDSTHEAARVAPLVMHAEDVVIDSPSGAAPLIGSSDEDTAGGTSESSETGTASVEDIDVADIAMIDGATGGVLSARPAARGLRRVPPPLPEAPPPPTATAADAISIPPAAASPTPIPPAPAAPTPIPLVAASPAPVPPAPATPTPTPLAAGAVPAPPTSGGEAASLAALNQVRVDAGVPPLTLNSSMSVFALEWSQEMSQSGFRHSSGPYGENVAWYSNVVISAEAAAAHFNSRWVNSPGHYANMTHGRYTEVGIALYQNVFGWWATHVFR